MSCQIFLVFFLLLFLCYFIFGRECTVQSLQSLESDKKNKIDEFFAPYTKKQIDILNSQGQKERSEITIDQIESVFFVPADGMMVALAEVSDKGQNEKFNILAKFFEIKEGNNWGDEVVKQENEAKWNVQLAAKDLAKKDNTLIKSVAVAVKENNVFYITVSNSTLEDKKHLEPLAAPGDWHVRLVVGEVNTGTTKPVVGSETAKTIKWKQAIFSGSFEGGTDLKKKLNTKYNKAPTCDAHAFVNSDEKNIIFFMKCKAADNSVGDKNITAVFQFENNGGKKLKLLYADDDEGCFPSFFQWNDEVYKRPTDDPECKSKKLMVYDKNGNTFNDSTKPISCLRDFLKDKNNFANTKIDSVNVLLFTQQKQNDSKNDAHLWIANSSRVSYVGPIITGFTKIFYGPVLHTNNQLFALHQKYSDKSQEENKYTLTLLKEQMSNITKILNAWKKSKQEIENLCKQTATTVISCSTDGLVGFLSHTKKNNGKWKDEYLGGDASVAKGTTTLNGIKFENKGVGTVWSVDKPTVDQPYNFTYSGFTLVATVSIDKNAEEDGSALLGVDLNDDKKLVRLWCSNKKWALGVGGKSLLKESTEKCEQEKEYSIALVLKEGMIFVYINWKQQRGLNSGTISIDESQYIANFYVGADSETTALEKNDVTIRNVLLYNRPFTEEEIAELKEKVTPPPQNEETVIQPNKGGNNNNSEQLENNKMQTDSSSTNTLITKSHDDEQSSSPPPTTEDSAVRVGGVGVLCFMLFGVFTLLGRYVY